MSMVKGLVLLSRLEYLENLQGPAISKDFLKKISTEEQNFVRQPIDGANLYPEDTLVEIDRILLDEYFNGDVDEFRKLGIWNAEFIMTRFFQLYIEEQTPIEFLEQYARLREAIIGTGEMHIEKIGSDKLLITIDYGQTIPKSVCMSELGFLEGSMRLCGAKILNVEEISCASEPNVLESKFKIAYV